MSEIGHNSMPGDNGQLIAFIDRIERLEENIKSVQEDRKEVYSELKGSGYDPKIVRKLIGLRKQDADKRAEENSLLELYAEASGTRI